MGFFDGYDIAVSGMSAQRTRVNITSSNIANAKTTHTEDGGPYKRQSVAFQEIMLNQNKKTNETSFDNNKDSNQVNLRGVGVKSIIEDDSDPVMRFEPSHPDANEEGYVAYPNINPVIEMVNLLEARRSYEANVTAFSTHKNIDVKTIDIMKA
ncbi:flagellar basal body rod protein FlgC [Halarcobacter mediterraneus]|uniref:Flagellar basal-body rod protein FlgC n=1 Tax=Halarcobacter mediterraneus TaxID=2023153 RepID=A0A4V1M123_9BACT|nr:flagellar basal body rod protein FlgC [Halarcobacter mediterraneus]RXK11893.1 flagellar basal body rod protein FlgC [Halarcobacter mediterraneus]